MSEKQENWISYDRTQLIKENARKAIIRTYNFNTTQSRKTLKTSSTVKYRLFGR